MSADESAVMSDPSLNMATGNRVHGLAVRKNDLYETPPQAVRALLATEPVPLTVWEPSCGPGAIVRVLRASGRVVIATDLVDYGCEDSIAQRDFLMERKAPETVSFDECADEITRLRSELKEAVEALQKLTGFVDWLEDATGFSFDDAEARLQDAMSQARTIINKHKGE